MATSERNQLGVSSGARQLSALEACLPVSDKALYGVQPHGVRDGRFFEVTSRDLLQSAGVNWVHTMVDGGGDAGQVIAIQDPTATLGPFLKITTNDAQHDNNQIQYGVAKTLGSSTVSAYAPFVAKAGYNLHFSCRFMVGTTVANAALLFGLSIVDTTLLASSVIDTASFIGFYKAASATMGGVVRTSSTSTTTALNDSAGNSSFTPTVNTWHEVGFKLIGRDSITFYVDGKSTGSTTMTNLPANTVVLTPSLVVCAGTAAVATCNFRGIYAGQEVI